MLPLEVKIRKKKLNGGQKFVDCKSENLHDLLSKILFSLVACKLY